MADDHEVGYGKPPKHTRFQKGRSGNPEGRLKGTKNLKTDLMEELKETVTVTEGGRRRSISKQRLVLKSLFAKAAKGDVRAVQVILSTVERLLLTDAADAEVPALSESEREILHRFLSEGQAARTPGEDDGTA